jgi:hypothetical protein
MRTCSSRRGDRCNSQRSSKCLESPWPGLHVKLRTAGLSVGCMTDKLPMGGTKARAASGSAWATSLVVAQAIVRMHALAAAGVGRTAKMLAAPQWCRTDSGPQQTVAPFVLARSSSGTRARKSNGVQHGGVGTYGSVAGAWRLRVQTRRACEAQDV